ncbi:MAG TPA: MFS transporter [Kofleriaceae bacterium]|nr:MFS transporter [Kofleriaceae bacterium]
MRSYSAMPGETARGNEGDRSPLEKFLALFADVKRGEAITALLMFLNIFLILTAYYILKPVREALTIGGVRLWNIEGDEAKTYLSVLMAVLLIGIVPLYGYLGQRMKRLKLLWITTIFTVTSLVAFFLWGSATGVNTGIGVSFFVWLGIVNYFLVAQFWSYANDIYTEQQGKRLFALVAIGQSLGGLLGTFITDIGSQYIFWLMGLAAAILMVCITLYTIINRREDRASDAAKRAAAEKPLDKEGGFQLVFKTKYLFLIAMTVLITNVVNTTGEYLLSNAAKIRSREQVPASLVVSGSAASDASAAAPGRSTSAAIDEKTLTAEQQQELRNLRGANIGKFYGRFYFIVNLVGLIIQMFLVSRIIKYMGVRVALFVMPLVALGGYAAIGVLGGLMVIRVVKTAENAIDYSLQNTIKQALFLPLSREAKYKAKAATDVFFVRIGDALSAGVIALGLHVFGFGVGQLAYVNVVMCALWIAICVGIAREHRRLAHEADAPAGAQAAPTA